MQKRPAAGSSADLIGCNLDILSEIFQFLPVKSLIAFKLVSKQWRSLISDTRFCIHHFRHQSQPKTPSGFYFYNSLTKTQKTDSCSRYPREMPSLPSLSYLDTISQRTNSTITVLQAANGILLCCFTFISKLCIHVVTNPVNRGIHVLPFLSNTFEPEPSEVILCYHLVFDSIVSDHILVFCIKNIKLPLIDNDCFVPGPCMVYMYSFETERWDLIYNFDLSLSNLSTRGVYWNGGIHWIGGDSSLHYDIKANKVTTRVMPPKPRGPEDWHKIRYFGESCGHLHLIQAKSLNTIKFNILELDKEKWTWFVKYRVHLGRIMQIFPEVVIKFNVNGGIKKHMFSILGVVREENEDNCVLVMAIPGKVIAYNLKFKIPWPLCKLPGEVSEDFRFIPVSSFQYAESLFPVRQRSLK